MAQTVCLISRSPVFCASVVSVYQFSAKSKRQNGKALERDKWSEERDQHRIEAASRQSEEQRISTELQEVQTNILADNETITESQQALELYKNLSINNQMITAEAEKNITRITNSLEISTTDRDYYVRRRTELESQLNKLITQQP
jgi:hypothetical protein